MQVLGDIPHRAHDNRIARAVVVVGTNAVVVVPAFTVGKTRVQVEVVRQQANLNFIVERELVAFVCKCGYIDVFAFIVVRFAYRDLWRFFFKANAEVVPVDLERAELRATKTCPQCAAPVVSAGILCPREKIRITRIFKHEFFERFAAHHIGVGDAGCLIR